MTDYHVDAWAWGNEMRAVVVLVGLMLLSGCVGSEDAGVRAAKMEAQDDASCRQLSAGKGVDSYSQCRRNLLYYRQQAAVEEQRKQARVSEALEDMSRAMRSIDNPPQNVNVTVTCAYGPGRC